MTSTANRPSGESVFCRRESITECHSELIGRDLLDIGHEQVYAIT